MVAEPAISPGGAVAPSGGLSRRPAWCRGHWLPLVFAAVFLPVSAQELPDRPMSWRVGECAQLREGGGGAVLKAPTYWLRGRVEALETRRHRAGVCPYSGKAPSMLNHAEWLELAAAVPCVARAEEVRELDVPQVLLTVESWETPWTRAHGHAGMLYRGHYLDQALVRGMRLAIDAQWLERCPAGRPQDVKQ